VQEKLDALIKTILDLLKNDNGNLPPINYSVPAPFDGDSRFDPIWRGPLGGYQFLCMVDDADPIVDEGTTEESSGDLHDKAREMANRILGRA